MALTSSKQKYAWVCTESGTNIPNRMHTNESRYAHVGLGGNSLQCPQMFVVLMRKDIIMSETEMVLTWPVWLNLTHCLSLSYPMQFLFCEFLCFRTGISSPFGNFHETLYTIAPAKNDELWWYCYIVSFIEAYTCMLSFADLYLCWAYTFWEGWYSPLVTKKLRENKEYQTLNSGALCVAW